MERWMKRRTRIALVGLVALLAIMIPILLVRRQEPQVQARFVAAAGETTGYTRAEGPRLLVFPADHGPHPDYQTEWWYYTGNLQTAGGRPFGYQLTFFRRALQPPALRQERSSAWAADQVYMAHFSISDIQGKGYQAFERFSRGAVGLAGAQPLPYRVWLEDWSVEEIGGGAVRMQAAQGGWSLDLTLVDQKGPVLHGEAGYSQKGPETGNASYYYSLTRLASYGTITLADQVYEVRGWSWMDHEFSTSALAPGQVGWDWFSLQLDDNSELMVGQLRWEDGSLDPFSSGTFVAADGRTRSLGRDEFEIQVEGTWQSPRTGAKYPAGWTVRVAAEDLVLRIEPSLADQELAVSYAYWEGAVRASGQRAGRPVSGAGYVELTGYAGSMQEQF
jgi:predicted secreted hydrolase